ncbi:hypothetical protein KPL70_017663 [Citrus sinensis]|nr:hypothetical protein KPL70_017663 [Citrus sinensis]
MAKLEFPRYASDNPTECFSKVFQFFEYQGTMEAQKVALASFHLEVGTFMRGLNPKISDGIRMFKPKTLKEAISLARMQEDQVQHKFSQPLPISGTPSTLPVPTQSPSTSNVKRLMWDEMQRRRAQGLCFNCPEKFSVGHKCMGPQILLLEGSIDARDIMYEETEITAEVTPTDRAKPKNSFHSLSNHRGTNESI